MADQLSIMRFLSNNRTRRCTAMAMLLVWLFALSAGVVNACALQNAGTHGHAQVDETVTVAPAAEAASITRRAPGHRGEP